MTNNIFFNPRSDAALSQPVLEEQSGESNPPSKRRRIMPTEKTAELPKSLISETHSAILSIIEKASQFYIECPKLENIPKQEKIQRPGIQKHRWVALFQGIEPGVSQMKQMEAAKSLATLTNAFYFFHLQKLVNKSKESNRDGILRQQWEAVDKAIAPGASKKIQLDGIFELESILRWRKWGDKSLAKRKETRGETSKKKEAVSELSRSPTKHSPLNEAATISDSYRLNEQTDFLESRSPPSLPNSPSEFNESTAFLSPKFPVFSVTSTPERICSDLLPPASLEVIEVEESENSMESSESVKTRTAMLAVIQRASQCVVEERPWDPEESYYGYLQKSRWKVLSRGIAVKASEEERTKAAESLIALIRSIYPRYLQEGYLLHCPTHRATQRSLWEALDKGIKSGASQEEQAEAVTQLTILLKKHTKPKGGQQ